MRTPKRRPIRGFTLVELMIVVAIIGVLAALAIYGVRRYLVAAKTSEAKNSIGAISRSAQNAYERETIDSQLLGDGSNSNAASHALCKSSLNPVPAAIPLGKKTQPDTTAGKDFDTGDVLTGWKCLRFSVDTPIYFQYNYHQGAGYVSSGLTGAPDPGATGFEASAQGDLDGNGAASTFAMSGAISASGHLKVATQVFVDSEFE